MYVVGQGTAPALTTRAGEGVVRFYQAILTRRKLFASLSLGLAVLLLAGTTRLRNDTYTLGYFPDSHRVVTDHRAMEAWGPYMPLELLVALKLGLALDNGRVVRAAAAFAYSVRTLPGTGQVFGFHSFFQAGLEARFRKRAGRALHSQGALRAVHARLLTDYPVLAAQFMHAPSRTGRITVSGRMLSARQLTAQLNAVLAIAGATLGPGTTVTPAGYQPMCARITDYVTTSQTNSLLASFGLVFVLT